MLIFFQQIVANNLKSICIHYINILPVVTESDIEYMIVAATKATSFATTIYVSRMGIQPTHVKVENIVPNYNLSTTGSKKLPSLPEMSMCVQSIN